VGGLSGLGSETAACDRCLARPWLLSRLSAHLEVLRGRIQELLALGDADLIAAAAGRDAAAITSELARFEPGCARHAAAAAGLELICRCDPAYPPRLTDLLSPPAVLYVAGGVRRLLELCERDSVAIVGSRKASSYGSEVARALGRGLGRAGLPVLSGMALGIDAAAHAGALSVAGPTIAVLPGSAASPYPASKRSLHLAITSSGVAIGEAAPGSPVRRWTFPARNRLIAALASMTVVVEAGESSGALLTAELARGLGRAVGAVPGRVDNRQAAGSNELLAQGASVVRGPPDVVEELYGEDAAAFASDQREPLRDELRALLDAIGAGEDTACALASAGVAARQGLAALAELELNGYVRRLSGGRYAVIP
jgi:DNA processing protein